jgi:hypothetical protein
MGVIIWVVAGVDKGKIGPQGSKARVRQLEERKKTRSRESEEKGGWRRKK